MVRGDLVAADQFWRAEPSIRGSWPLVLSEAHDHAALRAELALMERPQLALDRCALTMLEALDAATVSGAAGNLFTPASAPAADIG